jgi:hypothetical protein
VSNDRRLGSLIQVGDRPALQTCSELTALANHRARRFVRKLDAIRLVNSPLMSPDDLNHATALAIKRHADPLHRVSMWLGYAMRDATSGQRRGATSRACVSEGCIGTA